MSRAKDRTALEQVEFMRNLLAFMLVGSFIGMLPALLLIGIPEKNEQIITYMLGQLSGMAITALGFYFVSKVGQDALDAKRTDNTAKAFEAVTAAATAGGATGEPDVTLKPGQTATVEAEPTREDM